jgi:hypothetical protein
LISKKTKTRDEEEEETALGLLEHQTHLVLATQICNKFQKPVALLTLRNWNFEPQ